MHQDWTAQRHYITNVISHYRVLLNILFQFEISKCNINIQVRGICGAVMLGFQIMALIKCQVIRGSLDHWWSCLNSKPFKHLTCVLWSEVTGVWLMKWNELTQTLSRSLFNLRYLWEICHASSEWCSVKNPHSAVGQHYKMVSRNVTSGPTHKTTKHPFTIIIWVRPLCGS